MPAKKVKVAKKDSKTSKKSLKEKSEVSEIKDLTTAQIEPKKESSKSEIISYQEAKKYVNSIKNFYKHFTSFIVVILFIIAVNLIVSPNDFTGVFSVIFIWGLGLTLHGLSVFVWSSIRAKKWEQKMIKDLTKEK